MRPGSLPNFAKEVKAQESSVRFLERQQEFPEGQLEGLSFKQITNGALQMEKLRETETRVGFLQHNTA